MNLLSQKGFKSGWKFSFVEVGSGEEGRKNESDWKRSWWPNSSNRNGCTSSRKNIREFRLFTHFFPLSFVFFYLFPSSLTVLSFLFLHTNVWCCVSGRKVLTWYKWRAGSEGLTSLFPSSAIGIHISFISFLSICLTVVSYSRKTISPLLSFFSSVTGNGFFHYLRIHSLGSSFSCRSNQSLFNHSFTNSFLSEEFRSVFLVTVSSAPQFFPTFIEYEKKRKPFHFLTFLSSFIQSYKSQSVTYSASFLSK